MHSASWYAYGSSVAPDTQRVVDQDDHVGANHASTVMALKLDHPDGSAVEWFLVDTDGARVSCSYTGEVHDRRHVIHVPRSYGQRIQSSDWKVHWTVTLK